MVRGRGMKRGKGMEKEEEKRKEIGVQVQLLGKPLGGFQPSADPVGFVAVVVVLFIVLCIL